MKIYKLRAKMIRSDGGSEWLAEVDAEELRRALAADPLDVEMASPTTIHVNVRGSVLGTEEEVAAAVREAVSTMRPWRPRRGLDRRYRQQPIDWIDRRRQHWYITGRRRTDLYRSDRRRGTRRVLARMWRIDQERRTAWRGRRRDDSRAERRLGERRAGDERRTMRTEGFWRHLCVRNVVFVGLWSTYCPDCGASYTTVNDRRRLGHRRTYADRRRP